MQRFRSSVPSTLTPEATLRPQFHQRPHRLLIALILTVLFPIGFVAVALPAYGAVVLEYFNAIPSSSAVLLEWSTASEYNVAGFEVLCKRADEPSSAYHRIGFFNAKGNATQGAHYDMLVTQLEPGVPYCFRLQEVTSDDEPGESRERCGYGLSLTPTPTSPFVPSAPVTVSVGITPTVVLFPAPTGVPGLLTPTPTFDPLAPMPTWTPTVDPFFSPLPTPTPFPLPATATLLPGQATATPLGSVPFDAAAAGGEAAIDAVALTMTADPLLLAQQQATPDPNLAFPTATPDPLLAQPQSPLAAPTLTVAPTLPLSPTLTPATLITGTLQSSSESGAESASSGALPAAPADEMLPTPTALYVVVTAAPSQQQELPPPVTPWPTATPVAPFQLASLTTPTAQNLTVMLLCFIFISASGLGVLGLVTTILYMRSRSQRDLDELRLRYRRRP